MWISRLFGPEQLMFEKPVLTLMPIFRKHWEPGSVGRNTPGGFPLRKDLAEGEAATTLLVCPHVKPWESFEVFQEFYQNQLMNGYLFAEKDGLIWGLWVFVTFILHDRKWDGFSGVCSGDPDERCSMLFLWSLGLGHLHGLVSSTVRPRTEAQCLCLEDVDSPVELILHFPPLAACKAPCTSWV